MINVKDYISSGCPGGLQWQTNTNWGLYQASWRFRLAPKRMRDINRQHISPPLYLADDHPDFKAFLIFLKLGLLLLLLDFLWTAHASSPATFTLLLFFPSLTFKRLRRAAPAVANWRCQFAKFSSRVQIEPNARMLVNNKNAAIKSEVNCLNPKQCHTLREVGKWLARVLSGAVAACLFVS